MPLARFDAPFDHPDWIFEPKMDGFRAVAYVEGGTCRLVSRNRNAFKTFEPLAQAIAHDLSGRSAILDGEIVRPGPDGRPMFYELMRRHGPFRFYAFDLLWLDGSDLRDRPLLERKRLLRKLLPRRPKSVLYVDYWPGGGVEMRTQLCTLALIMVIHAGAIWSQSVPIYRVTVIERSVKAVSYQYLGGQTQVDFAGTVLLPRAQGTAIVESKSGRTQIGARFSNLAAPNRFGGEYLTYVLWAITPEGHAKNLGEVLTNSADRGHLSISTDLQAFGMIVTAEPYSAVRLPSDVVVLENVVRADTIGRIEPIQAKYELLPRGQYTYTPPEGPPAEGPKVSMSRYESLLQIYQAQNAVQIARAQGADKYAADTLAKAERLLAEARQMEERHAGRSSVVTLAREAAQTAEDARAITMRHKDDAQ